MSKPCIRCQSDKILSVSAKCNDLCRIEYKKHEYDGYVPDNLNIGDGDCVGFSLCIQCGIIQAEWPLKEEIVNKLERDGPGSVDEGEEPVYIHPVPNKVIIDDDFVKLLGIGVPGVIYEKK